MKQLTRQYNTGPYLGAVKDLASRSVMYISFLSFIQISSTFYYTTLKPPVTQYAPWISIWMYFLFLIIMVLIIMVTEYKLIIPSSYIFLNNQEYKHQNLIRKDLKEIKDILELKVCPHCGKELEINEERKAPNNPH